MPETLAIYNSKGRANEVAWEDAVTLDPLADMKAHKNRNDVNQSESAAINVIPTQKLFAVPYRMPKKVVGLKVVPVVHMARPLFGPHDPRHSSPGIDIVALKRALWRMELFSGPAKDFDENFNDKLLVAVKKVQRQAKFAFASGNVGWQTWDYIRHQPAVDYPKQSAFDALAIHYADMAWRNAQMTPLQHVQNAGVDAACFWIAHKDESSYAQIRPIIYAKPPYIPRRADCSWHVSNVHFAGGAPDPNGLGYNGNGYTGTLHDHCHAVSIHDIQILDLVFYGFTTRPSPAFPYGSPTHVAVYIGGGMVSSDGSNSGPEKRPIGYRTIHSVRRNKLV